MMELHRFRLVEGTDPLVFWKADEQLQEGWYYQRRGMMRRMTNRSEDGWWVTMVWWSDDTPDVPDVCPLLEVDSVAGLVDARSLSVDRFSGRPDSY